MNIDVSTFIVEEDPSDVEFHKGANPKDVIELSKLAASTIVVSKAKAVSSKK